jgi:hypothetical protein
VPPLQNADTLSVCIRWIDIDYGLIFYPPSICLSDVEPPASAGSCEQYHAPIGPGPSRRHKLAAGGTRSVRGRGSCGA